MKERTPDTTGRPVEDERVTVVVASRNRRDDLTLTLRRHRAPAILVDNASRDGTLEFVSAEFPDVRMIRMVATPVRSVGRSAPKRPEPSSPRSPRTTPGGPRARCGRPPTCCPAIRPSPRWTGTSWSDRRRVRIPSAWCSSSRHSRRRRRATLPAGWAGPPGRGPDGRGRVSWPVLQEGTTGCGFRRDLPTGKPFRPPPGRDARPAVPRRGAADPPDGPST